MRLRFAPSPTGMLHVGNARAGLFNWLHARHHGATVILRIEDTDEERSKTEWIEGIGEALNWLGIDWDEGPYMQSANRSLHAEAGERLFEENKAYYCDCTREDVDARNSGTGKQGYDRHCRDRGLEPGPGRALRFKVPTGKTEVKDLVRGSVVFDNESIEDFVVVRGNGGPLYLLANVVDDMNDRVTHVVRGEDHLPNTPKQVLLWQALSDQPLPEYAHLPLLVSETGKKLSKRRDTVAIEDFRAKGYLAETMVNYMALLGWSPRPDASGAVNEIVDVKTMIEQFDLADVQPSPARFDMKKLANFNGHYIRELSLGDFAQRLRPFVPGSYTGPTFDALLPLAQTRVELLTEVAAQMSFAFDGVKQYERTELKPAEAEVLKGATERFADVDWNAEALHAATLEVGEANGLKLGKAQAPIRMAVTGSKVGLPLFESLEVLGRDETLKRLAAYSAASSVA